ncbi:hypothetical protein EOPP23_07230 [Endozoicomonas sp. OPT23]|uniref:nuclear transport factor 2 family protein n=1 Tax=Endozoicomonas sp. OPT23 TaxID=2072845 RepID=UPI00129A317B|nr:nuclear transport factor 2 family protein [Endozoicomonas sp. OPT23]MRI32774.1 hypothetical protein [Endozoicomonas sp. OPT23]
MSSHPLVDLAKNFAAHHSSQNSEAALRLFTHDQKIHYWGTGSDEEGFSISDLKSQLARDHSEVDQLQLSMNKPQLMTTESSGVLIAMWLARYQRQGSKQWHEMPLRGTLYGEQIDGQWLLRHGHWSVAFSEQPEGRSFPLE